MGTPKRPDEPILVFPHHGDPKKARAVKAFLILSSLLWNPRAGNGDVAMLVLLHCGDLEMVGGGLAISIFPQYEDPKEAGDMKPLIILSPFWGDLREGNNDVLRRLFREPRDDDKLLATHFPFH